MTDRKLLASVALFSELFDSGKDIYDVIGELIKTAILLENRWVFNVTNVRHMLDQIFGFQLPDAVVN